MIDARAKGIGMIMDMIVNHIGDKHWWMSDLLANDYIYADPNALMIFPDNHDMDRIYTQLNEDYSLSRD